MNLFKCSKEAHEKCPDSHVCDILGEAMFLENSPCHKFNSQIEAEIATQDLDLVSVVRCKDCKHYERGQCYHERHNHHSQSIHQNEDDFCSYGAKMDGGNEDG